MEEKSWEERGPDPTSQAVGGIQSVGVTVTGNCIRSDAGRSDSDLGAKIFRELQSVTWGVDSYCNRRWGVIESDSQSWGRGALREEGGRVAWEQLGGIRRLVVSGVWESGQPPERGPTGVVESLGDRQGFVAVRSTGFIHVEFEGPGEPADG